MRKVLTEKDLVGERPAGKRPSGEKSTEKRPAGKRPSTSETSLGVGVCTFLITEYLDLAAYD